MAARDRSIEVESRWRRARHSVPFLIGLAFSLALLAANFDKPRLGSAGIVPLIPAVLMTVLAFILFAVRSGDTPACLLAVFLATLAVIARYNTAGLIWLPFVGPPAPPPKLEFQPVHVVWTYALGWVPLYFGWVYTEQDRGRRRPMAARRVGVILLALFAVAQAGCIYAAIHGFEGVGLFVGIASHVTSRYHRLLIYCGPVLLIEQAAAFWLLVRHYYRDRENRNLALLLIFGSALLFVACAIINDVVATAVTNIMANGMAYVVPITVVYALESHALFDIRIFIRRTQQYAFARQVLTVLTVAPLVALAFVYGMAENPDHSARLHVPLLGVGLEARSSLVTGVLTAVVVAVLVLRAPLLRSFDRAYFREVYDAQRIVSETGRSLMAMTDAYEIARTALTGIEEVVRPKVSLFLANEEGIVVCLARRATTGYRPPVAIHPGLLLIDRIREVPRLDRPRAPGRRYWTDDLPVAARDLLADARIRLALPFRESGETRGIALLGDKGSGEPYTPEDLDVLTALCRQIALALETAHMNRQVLKRGTRELKEGSVSFIELVERERRLLAADLHDQTLPDLRALLADLERLADDRSTARRGIESNGANGERTGPDAMVDHLRQAIENIRDIMESLRPSALEMLGLYPALESELRKATARACPPIVPQYRVMSDVRPENLGSFEEMSIFRITQEAVNNACRHSLAKTVRVQIGVQDGDWILRIEDDGTGIPDRASDASGVDSPLRRGNGLDNMRYRASLIGGRLSWEPPDWGRGTSVVLRLPLTRHAGLESLPALSATSVAALERTT